MSIKGIEDNEWGDGCEDCYCGLIAPPEQHLSVPLYVQRTAEAEAGQLTFCACRAGVAYRAHLRNNYLRMKKDHADSVMLQGLVGRIREGGPTVHWVGANDERDRPPVRVRTKPYLEPAPGAAPEPTPKPKPKPEPGPQVAPERVPEPAGHYADDL